MRLGGGGASQVPEIVAWSRRKGMQRTNTMRARGVTMVMVCATWALGTAYI